MQTHRLDPDGRPRCDKGVREAWVDDPYLVHPVEQWAADAAEWPSCHHCRRGLFREARQGREAARRRRAEFSPAPANMSR
jgi:hypothetical protein